jgi:hypothetical protein
MSRAVWLTSWMVCFDPAPGTVTTRRLVPSGWTWAPELPVPLTRDKMTVSAAFRSPLEGGFPDRVCLQGHLGPAGQVKAESYLELALPLGRAEQLSAEYPEQHGQDEHEQSRERPSRMRDGS